MGRFGLDLHLIHDSLRPSEPTTQATSRSVQRFLQGSLHCVSKNVPPLTCYNLDKHDPIAIIFGRSITEKIRNHTMFCFPTSSIYCFRITLRKRKPRRQRTGALCVQHSPTAAALSTSFLLYHAPNNPKLNALITRFRESYSSMRMSRESKRLKESSTDWLNSGNALIQRVKNAIFVFTVLPGSTEAQVI